MKRIISVLIQMILMAMLISSATFSQNLIELTQYRTRYSKTFLDPATGYLKYYTATLRLHYVENGNWLDIDNSINNLNANFFARQGSDMEVYFSKGETQTEFRIGQEWIRLSLSGLTIWEDEQILDQFSSQSPLVTVVDSLLRYSDNIPYHDLTYCVFNDRVRWQVVISNDILNTYSTVTDFEYEFEIEYSAGLDFSPAIISYHLPGSNIPVHFYSDSLVYASISQWLVRNEQGIISVDDIEFTPLSGKRFRVNCRMNADHILNNFPSDSTIIEAVLFQLAVREQNPQSSVNDYYTADRIHNGAVVEWTWGSLTNYDWSFLPWVGHYDDYSYGSNEKYRAYFYWELDGIPSVSTIEQVDYFKVEVVNKAEGPNPSSCLTINTRNLIFDENNLSNYEALYNAIDDGSVMNSRSYCNIGDEWDPPATEPVLIQQVQSAVNAERNYFAIGLHYTGSAQDLLLEMESGDDIQNFALLIEYQAPTGIFSGDPPTASGYSLTNYPNPFNPQTTIEFKLPMSETITLLIYNNRGQLVKELLNQQFSAGVHKVIWDGSNDHALRVASGIYWIYLITPSYRKTIQTTLIK